MERLASEYYIRKENYCFAQALDRRGQARVELKKYEEAIEDFQKAKEVDPKTKNTEDKIDFARKLLEEKTKKEQKEEEEAKFKSKEEVAEEKEQSKSNEEDKEEGDKENKSKEESGESGEEGEEDIGVNIQKNETIENETKHEKEEPSATLKKPTEKTKEELRLEIEVRK